MTTNMKGISHAKVEPFFVRHAWKVLLGVILLIGFFGVTDMVAGAADLQQGESVLMHALTGKSWDALRIENPPAADLVHWKFRTGGASLLTFAILETIICLTGFRKGERWAWYALWTLPLWMLLTVFFTWTAIRYPEFGTPVPIISGSVLSIISVLCFALTYRKFFSRNE